MLNIQKNWKSIDNFRNYSDSTYPSDVTYYAAIGKRMVKLYFVCQDKSNDMTYNEMYGYMLVLIHGVGTWKIFQVDFFPETIKKDFF